MPLIIENCKVVGHVIADAAPRDAIGRKLHADIKIDNRGKSLVIASVDRAKKREKKSLRKEATWDRRKWRSKSCRRNPQN